MNIISQKITDYLNGKINQYEIPIKIRSRVLQGAETRKQRHTTRGVSKPVFNTNNTVTVQNARIRVTLPADEFNNIGKCETLNWAMRVLGNRVESGLMETETLNNDNENNRAVFDFFVHKYLMEHGRYRIEQIWLRYVGGHRMSDGMAADISAAQSYALTMINTPAAKEILTDIEKFNIHMHLSEIQHRRLIGDCDWKIEIIGEMPNQIGLCRYE